MRGTMLEATCLIYYKTIPEEKTKDNRNVKA